MDVELLQVLYHIPAEQRPDSKEFATPIMQFRAKVV
jgi:hypothetical protein